MSVQGVGPGGLPHWLRGPAGAPTPQEGEAARESQQQSGAAAARTEKAAVVPPPTEGATEPGAVPDGVDAELWTLLTTEERAHFARFAAMGGVTYGPRAAEGTSSPPVRGQRLDLRI